VNVREGKHQALDDSSDIESFRLNFKRLQVALLLSFPSIEILLSLVTAMFFFLLLSLNDLRFLFDLTKSCGFRLATFLFEDFLRSFFKPEFFISRRSRDRVFEFIRFLDGGSVFEIFFSFCRVGIEWKDKAYARKRISALVLFVITAVM
jgi:hypothetical protein